MITGFLFWLRVLRAGNAFDTRAFLLSRVRRLTPMYAMSVLMVLAVVAAASGHALHTGPAELARELRPWLSFGLMDTGPVNGLDEARYINAVYWTLAYEWMFYLALPLLALFARGWRAALLVAVVLMFGAQKPIVFNFLFGAAVAWIVHRRLLEGACVIEGRLRSPWLTAVPLLSLGAYFALPGGNGLPQSLALFGFFIFVVHGTSLFGLLRTRAAKVLGTISYSIYLTHCISLFVTVHAVDRLVPIRTVAGGASGCSPRLPTPGCVLLSAVTFATSSTPSSIPNRPASRSGPKPRRSYEFVEEGLRLARRRDVDTV